MNEIKLLKAKNYAEYENTSVYEREAWRNSLSSLEDIQTVIKLDVANVGRIACEEWFTTQMKNDPAFSIATKSMHDIDPSLTWLGNKLAWLYIDLEAIWGGAQHLPVSTVLLSTMSLSDTSNPGMRLNFLHHGTRQSGKTTTHKIIQQLLPGGLTFNLSSQTVLSAATKGCSNGQLIINDELSSIYYNQNTRGYETAKQLLSECVLWSQRTVKTGTEFTSRMTYTEQMNTLSACTSKHVSNVEPSIVSCFFPIPYTRTKRRLLASPVQTELQAKLQSALQFEWHWLPVLAGRVWAAIHAGRFPISDTTLAALVSDKLYETAELVTNTPLARCTKQQIMIHTLNTLIYEALTFVFTSGKIFEHGKVFKDEDLFAVVPYLVSSRAQLCYAFTSMLSSVVHPYTEHVVDALQRMSQFGDEDIYYLKLKVSTLKKNLTSIAEAVCDYVDPVHALSIEMTEDILCWLMRQRHGESGHVAALSTGERGHVGFQLSKHYACRMTEIVDAIVLSVYDKHTETKRVVTGLSYRYGYKNDLSSVYPFALHVVEIRAKELPVLIIPKAAQPDLWLQATSARDKTVVHATEQELVDPTSVYFGMHAESSVAETVHEDADSKYTRDYLHQHGLTREKVEEQTNTTQYPHRVIQQYDNQFTFRVQCAGTTTPNAFAKKKARVDEEYY